MRLAVVLLVGCVGCASERDLARDGEIALVRYSSFPHRPYTSLVFKDARVGGFGVTCDSPAAAVRSDITRHRFAFRCDPNDEWQLFYVAPKSGWIFPTKVTLGKGRTPSFEHAKPLAEAAPDLVYVGNATARRRIFEAFEDQGDEALLSWLRQPLAMDETCWEEFANKLTEQSRAELRAVAKRELEKPDLKAHVRRTLESFVKSGA